MNNNSIILLIIVKKSTHALNSIDSFFTVDDTCFFVSFTDLNMIFFIDFDQLRKKGQPNMSS